MLLGIDAGNARVKVCGSAGAIDFDAALGEWRQRNLINDHGLDDMEVDYAGKRYFAGSLARCESEFGGTMMGNSKAHEEARIRVLLAAARYEASSCRIVTGQPIGRHSDSEKGRIVSLLRGTHSITVNGHRHRITITDVKVAAEGAAAFWSAPQSGLVRIVDIGSGTVNCATIYFHRYVDRDSFTLPYGFDSTISTDRSAMADGIAREALKKWSREDRVHIVGGGAESIAPHIQRHFRAAEVLRPSLNGRQLHPVYANAIGYYHLARGLYD
ncbi:MAG: ParM/StbA family protein [Thermacetogeniaceae bacterium]|jgi:plasmid segregation protein ParM